MDDRQTPTESRFRFLLLRDGHAVPLAGISPTEIKEGARHRVPNPDAAELRHRKTLTAIVDRLGFKGDFGDYERNGWPAFQAFLNGNGCTHRAGLFPVDHGGCPALFLNRAGPAPRQLADRIFEAPAPAPSRVFLGYGRTLSLWDEYLFSGRGEADVIALMGGDHHTAERRVVALRSQRMELIGQFGFIDDKLVAGPVQHIVDKTYWESRVDADVRKHNHAQVSAATHAFREVFDTMQEGWVDVLRFNNRLVVLRGHDGGWDLLWRSLRESEPPKPGDAGRSHHLDVKDLPSSLRGESDLRRGIHFRQEVWEEREEHDAEQAFYDRGGSAASRRLTSYADVLDTWLVDVQGRSGPKPTRARGALAPGFRELTIDGRRLAVSDLVEVGAFRRLVDDTGYHQRRDADSEPWDRANDGVPDNAPVGATWADAQAYCAGYERRHGIAARLPSMRELRAIRAFHSERYAQLSGGVFWWEHYPPRPDLTRDADGTERRTELPSAVVWSEPRFLKPAADLPEFPPPDGLATTSRKHWIRDFPPRAAWKTDLPWAEHSGLRFIDAWDAYEWCQEPGWINGRYWEGVIGPTSWGAYKNVKVTFRIVLELDE